MSISNKALRVEPCDQADPYVSCKISFQDFKRTSCACPEPVFQDLCPEEIVNILGEDRLAVQYLAEDDGCTWYDNRMQWSALIPGKEHLFNAQFSCYCDAGLPTQKIRPGVHLQRFHPVGTVAMIYGNKSGMCIAGCILNRLM